VINRRGRGDGAAHGGGGAPAAPRGWHIEKKVLLQLPEPGRTVDVGMLLPRNATVVQIACGAQSGDAAPVECSMEAGCAAPVTVALDDDIYTQGRALTLMVTAKGNAKGESFHFWLAWK